MTKQIVLVTGGTGGIGEAISIKLHDAGYTVLVTYSPKNTGVDAWLANMEAQERRFKAFAVDVADYESCARCVAKILAEVGPVDILVNNAGITRDAVFKKLDKVDWDAVIRTNLDSVFNMTKPVCDGMVERGWGRIINISSIIGSKGGFGQTNYAAAKAGIHGFTKSLALEVAKKGVTVNTISPGFIATRMVMAVPQDVLENRIIPQIPVGRLGQPAEVAALVLYLCSREAGFLTGANIALNGGQHLQ
ncbi:acetoacetyl-CoA reductase [Paraburkholderia lacunae]|uniref:Beta-ketoacyl-ACP reductase n=1 Tax=Paraburkholderia lacunae TaxID=2211104 RepID=A0A370N5Y2_9BURK|nr:acetoacetyl-CoA reductase [Paraburkholderia lacunae]RDK01016.1 beta-ketoacyl-ACP reductase [Paraburkholderia lacunae]